MTATSLPARIVYALAAFLGAGLSGFYVGISLFTGLARFFPDEHPSMEGLGVFIMALALAAVLAFTAALVALTLPGIRLRKRRGRRARLIGSVVFVLFAALVIAGQGNPLVYDLALTIWLAFTVAFTFVRYGVLDQVVRRTTRDPAS